VKAPLVLSALITQTNDPDDYVLLADIELVFAAKEGSEGMKEGKKRAKGEVGVVRG
jgi:hypothetical protein